MELQAEIDVKRDLKDAKEESDKVLNESKRLESEAEGFLADAVAIAYLKGAGISFISSAASIPRQKVYMLLALKGIRPGRSNVNA